MLERTGHSSISMNGCSRGATRSCDVAEVPISLLSRLCNTSCAVSIICCGPNWGWPAGWRRRTRRCAIVDPACGSGAFLLEVLGHVCQTLAEQAQPAWTVEQWLLARRLVGIDVLPSSSAAAQLLLEREMIVRVPAPPAAVGPVPQGTAAPELVHCGNPLQDVHWCHTLFDGRLPVILGNPPYNNFGGHNRHPWILEQLRYYKDGLAEKKLNLDDDCIKCTSAGRNSGCEQTGRGIVALVTSKRTRADSRIAGCARRCSAPSTRSMCWTCTAAARSETAPDGSADENVFPIKPGVALGLFVKTGSAARRKCPVRYAELWGFGARRSCGGWAPPCCADRVEGTGTRAGPWHFFVLSER